VRLAAEHLCKTEAVFVTFTFKDNLTDKKEAATRWRRLKERLRRAYPDMCGVGVWQRQKRGAWHLHMIFDRCWLSVGDLRSDAVDCGFGTFVDVKKISRGGVNGFRPLEPSQVGRYLVRYMIRDARAQEEKGVRLSEYFGDAGVSTTTFSWADGLARVWRAGCEMWVTVHGMLPRFTDFESVLDYGWHSCSEVDRYRLYSSFVSVRSRWKYPSVGGCEIAGI